MMKYLIYISTSIKPCTDQDLADILLKSRKNNQRDQITGVLLYCEGTFIQLLEGPEKAVDEMFAVIKQDQRHRNIIKLVDDNLLERNFADWTMGFRTINLAEMQKLSGYFNLKAKDFKNEKGHPGVAIIKDFAERN